MIGGKVLDASALAALVRGRVSAAAWFATARTMSLPGCAGHIVHSARTRGWPTLTADPGRLRRVDPARELDLL